MRAKPSQPSDQGPAICDWGRFTAGANPHCQPRLFSISACSIHIHKLTHIHHRCKILIFYISKMLSPASLSFLLVSCMHTHTHTHRHKANSSCRRAFTLHCNLTLPFLKAWSNSVLHSKNNFSRLNVKKWETSMCHWVTCPGEHHSYEIGSSYAQVSH